MGDVLLASSGWRLRLGLNILGYTGKSCADVNNLWWRKAGAVLCVLGGWGSGDRDGR